MSQNPPSAHHLTPVQTVSRAAKEAQLGQRGQVLWLYGLSGSGKSTLALALEKHLFAAGKTVQVLDGDNIRTGLCANLGFTQEDRAENIRRIAEVAKLFCEAGHIVLCSFITPQEALRAQVRSIVPAEDLQDVYVHASFETCQQRDPKGLYKKVAAGQVPNFTGKDAAFEMPDKLPPTLTLNTESMDVDACLQALLGLIKG